MKKGTKRKGLDLVVAKVSAYPCCETQRAALADAVTENVAAHFSIQAAHKTGVDVYLMPEEAVVAHVTAATPKPLLLYHLLARFHGGRVASGSFLRARDSCSISFLRALRKPKQILFDQRVREKCPGFTLLIEELTEVPDCKWRIVTEPPKCLKGCKTFVALHGCSKSGGEGQTSLVEFINSITIVDVHKSTDGIRRRGIFTKK